MNAHPLDFTEFLTANNCAMSLRTDQFFYNALAADSSIMETVDGRIFNTARPTADEDEDRVPYIVITLDGVQNDGSTKDDVEGYTDSVQITILCVENDRESLADLTEAVREQCRLYLGENEDDTLAPYDWSFSAEAVGYDSAKPCVYQALVYNCSTNRD